uniref:Transposase Tnp1/En/Spm-like domain-containing protein n=1 Tax=Cucumis melo TaxID=3656 RepID=A0A9I9CUD2_CUCME
MEVEMTQMRSLISHLLKSQGNGSDQLSNVTNDQVVNNVATNPIGNSPPSINNNNTLRKCTLLDCGGVGEVVAKGRWSSNDPNVTVHHVPLGPHVVRVWVDLPKKSDAFLWRPNSEMTYIEDAVGSTVDERTIVQSPRMS